MHYILDGHPSLAGMTPGLRFFATQPEIMQEAVLQGGPPTDANGVSYGCVLRDAGKYRMWYQAWPADWDGLDVLRVGLAESDDGLVWRRCRCGLVDTADGNDNSLIDLPMHSVSVIIDPDSSADERYRAFGYFHPRALKGITGSFDHMKGYSGYATAASADGVHWPADKIKPLWESADVITAAARPGGDVTLMMKQNRMLRGRFRRAFCQAEWSKGVLSEPRHALWPTATDDQRSIERGFLGCDFYGVGLEPRRDGTTVGFLWRFLHQSPLGSTAAGSLTYGDRGQVDVGVVYQLTPSGGWHRAPGADAWLSPADAPDWAFGCIYTSPNIVSTGTEDRLYFTGTREYHGWVGAGAASDGVQRDAAENGGFARIGLARWPKDRLFGVRADYRECLYLHDVPVQSPMNVNAALARDGRLRAALVKKGTDESIEGYSLDDSIPITGDHTEAEIRWKTGNRYSGSPDGRGVSLKIELTNGLMYGWKC